MQDLNDLYYFVQVVDHGGFAPALCRSEQGYEREAELVLRPQESHAPAEAPPPALVLDDPSPRG